MALTIGTDTYISLADARQYITDNALSSLPDTDADAELLLKRAAKAIDRRWGNRFIGMRRQVDQALAWPRDVNVDGYRGIGESWAYTLDSDGNPRLFNSIPTEMGEAQTEMAVLMMLGEDPLQQNEAAVIEKTVEVGSLKTQKKYAASYQTPAFYNVVVILRPLLVSTASIKATRGA